MPRVKDADLVIMHTSSPSFASDAKVAEQLKAANPRMLIVHKVMGRNCGWLTAATGRVYRERLGRMAFLPEFNLDRSHKDVDAVYVTTSLFVHFPVTRDALMRAEAEHYPAYEFESNVGYPAPVHKSALAWCGPSAIHRRSWIFMDGLCWRGVPPPPGRLF